MKVITTNRLNRFWKNGILPKIAEKLAKSNVINNLTTTAAGYALDARQGKALKDEIDKTNTGLSTLNSNLSPSIMFSGSRVIESTERWHDTMNFMEYKRVDFTVIAQGVVHTFSIRPCGAESTHCVSFGYLYTPDNGWRELVLQFTTAGRFLTDVRTYMSVNRGAFTGIKEVIRVISIVGYNG